MKEEPLEIPVKEKIACMLHALTDMQQTIRAFDTKAQILLAISIGLSTQSIMQNVFKEFLPCGKFLIAGLFLCGIGSLIICMYPRKTSLIDEKRLSEVYFITSDNTSHIQLAKSAVNIFWPDVIYCQLARLAQIRDQKSRYIKYGYCLIALSYALFFIFYIIL